MVSEEQWLATPIGGAWFIANHKRMATETDANRGRYTGFSTHHIRTCYFCLATVEEDHDFALREKAEREAPVLQ